MRSDLPLDRTEQKPATHLHLASKRLDMVITDETEQAILHNPHHQMDEGLQNMALLTEIFTEVNKTFGTNYLYRNANEINSYFNH